MIFLAIKTELTALFLTKLQEEEEEEEEEEVFCIGFVVRSWKKKEETKTLCVC